MEFLNEMYRTLVASFPQIVAALLVLVVGLLVVFILGKITQKAFRRSRVDPTLASFFRPIIRITLYTVVVTIALSTAGVPTATLLTAFGAVGLAVSLAVKDSLANMAGGILLLISKPFAVGSAVEIDGMMGIVRKISILHTQINTFDNREIFIPNSKITADRVINLSGENTRRLDLTFSVSYRDDPERAKEIISEVVARHENAFSEPAPIIRVCELAESAVQIACYVWVKKENYLNLKFDLLEQVKAAFAENGISIPFPQLDVHVDPKTVA